MRRLAMLFALIAMLASLVSARSYTGQRFAGMASKIVIRSSACATLSIGS